MKKFYDIEKKYKFSNLISASSNISSYALLKHASKIITFGSRMGIEAVYAKKPSIILFRNFYEKLNSNYIPKNHKEVLKLINSDLKPKSILASEKYALYSYIGGNKLKGFKGSYDTGFSFHNNKIKLNTINKLLYFFGRFVDKFYYHYLRNIGLKTYLKSFFINFEKFKN